MFDGEDNLITTINLNDVSSYGFVDGKVIAQKIYEVDLESKDFTYIKEGKKYLLTSFSIDVKTGKQRSLELDYLIIDFSVFLDQNDEYKYGYVNGHKIENKNLIETDNYFLIDESGKIVADSGPINLLGLRKLGNNHFYDPSSGYVLNDKFAPMYFLGFSYSFSSNKNLIFIRKDNLFGAINYNGEIVIPFEYITLEQEFYSDNVLGTGIDGRKYLVAENYKYSIDSDLLKITPGLLFSIEYRNERALYVATIYDYKSTVKTTIETSVNVSHVFDNISSIYGEYMVKEFPKFNGGSTFVFIDISYKEVSTE